jgi:glycosyltransferase involved in cell wall biosynthesis
VFQWEEPLITDYRLPFIVHRSSFIIHYSPLTVYVSRVTLIAPFAVHPKGTTRWRVLPLARALAAQGHAVRVVIPPYDWPAHSGLAWRDRGVDVVNATLPSGLGAAGQLVLAAQLVERALAWQPDIVHVFKPKGPGGVAALWLLELGVRSRVALSRPAVPVVIDADDYEAGWNEVVGYPALWGRFFAWQERTLLRRAAAVTAASRWLEALATALGQQRCVYLPNGVEFSRSQDAICSDFSSPSTEPEATRQVLLYSRFVEHSPAEVWQVWRRVLAVQPEARLLIAGQGRRGEEQELARLAAQAGVEPSVRPVGWLPAASRPGLFAAVEAALLPVRDTPLNRAKSPMRLLDLLAAGVPVATQRVGEYGQLVADGVTGLLAEPGDVAGLAAHLLSLLRRPELRGRLGRAAVESVQMRHAWPHRAARVAEVYRRVMAG